MEVTHADFEKLNLRVGSIKAVQPHPKVEEYILLVDLGPAGHDRQIVADLKESYTMDELIGKQVIILKNMEPRIVGEIESQGVLLVAHKDGKPVLLQPDKEVLTGVQVAGLSDVEMKGH